MTGADMPERPNILFIMCDQLRQDYLSCYGHETLETPHIDSLAKRGVRFANAHCQAPLCGPSRASFYTGRYPSSHGVLGNEDATQLGERMLADYLAALGYRSAVVGKTHSQKNLQDLGPVGLEAGPGFAARARCGGFEPYEWHEGLYPDPILPENQGYTQYLKSLGYPEDNPWDRRANSGIDADGRLYSGWALRSSGYPAAVMEAHSETAFLTRSAMSFIEESAGQPWCLHLSYIKPHWPVIAPAPYHDLYGRDDIQAVVRSGDEKDTRHPVIRAFMELEYSRTYSREAVRDTVIPVYMGLIRQIDDHLGRLFAFLEARQQLGSTLIIFTSDHGDYLGDHWLGEKDLFHDPSVKIPLIVADPGRCADATRNTVCNEFVESVDIVPTVVEHAGGTPCRERLEGRSLLPLLHGVPAPDGDWRDATVSEIDYSERGARHILGIHPYRSRATMVRDGRWKYIHYQGFSPQLFDMVNDPQELEDLGECPGRAAVRTRMKGRIFEWQYALKRRPGLEYDYMTGQGPERDEAYGIIIGRW